MSGGEIEPSCRHIELGEVVETPTIPGHVVGDDSVDGSAWEQQASKIIGIGIGIEREGILGIILKRKSDTVGRTTATSLSNERLNRVKGCARNE